MSGKPSLSSFAQSFLKAPLQKSIIGNRDEDETAGPLFHSTYSHGESSSLASLPHLFGSQDPLDIEASIPSSPNIYHGRNEVEVTYQHGEDDEDYENENPYIRSGGNARRQEQSHLLHGSSTQPSPAQAPATARKPSWFAHQSLYPSSSSSSSSITSQDNHKHHHSRASSTSSSGSDRSLTSSAPLHGYYANDDEEDEDEDDVPREFLNEHLSSPTRNNGSKSGIAGLPKSSHKVPGGWMNGMTERLLVVGGRGSKSTAAGEAATPKVERLSRIRGGGMTDTFLGGLSTGGRGDWRKFNDSSWLALHLLCLMLTLGMFPFLWGSSSTVPPSTTPDHTGIKYKSPFSTLLHTLPLLSLLLIISTTFAPLLLFLLSSRQRIRYVLIGVCLAGVTLIAGSGWWMFVESFDTSDESTGGRSLWWAKGGCRLLSAMLTLVSGLVGWIVWRRRNMLERTINVVEISATFLLAHPPLLLLTPLLLIAFSILSLPILTILLRLLLVGYYEHPSENTWSYHLKPRAGWLIFGVICVWLWTWGVMRGIGKVTIAIMVGEWYFYRDEPPQTTQDPAFGDFKLESTKIAFDRATGPNLGSICLSALLMTFVKIACWIAAEGKRLTSPKNAHLPDFLHPLNALEPIFAILVSFLEQLNGYALVYVGVTGEPFLTSARSVGGLVARRGRSGGRKVLDYAFLRLLLNTASLAIASLVAAAGYLFAVHALNDPQNAPFAGMLCGGIVFLTVRFSLDGLSDTSDALFVCSAIDAEHGGQHFPEANVAIGGKRAAAGQNVV